MSAEQKILREDERLKVMCRGSEEHDFLINEDGEWISYLLQHGLLKQFSRSSPRDVEGGIYNANPSLHSHLSLKEISFEYVTRFLAQARNTELEEEVSYFIDKYNRERGLIE